MHGERNRWEREYRSRSPFNAMNPPPSTTGETHYFARKEIRGETNGKRRGLLSPNPSSFAGEYGWEPGPWLPRDRRRRKVYAKQTGLQVRSAIEEKRHRQIADGYDLAVIANEAIVQRSLSLSRMDATTARS